MKIKILQIIKSLGRGGAEMLLVETLKRHDRRAFEFHYAYFLPWKDQLVEPLKANGGNVICFNASSNPAIMLRARSVVKYILENEISVVHAHLPWAGIVARLVRKLCGVPVIYTEHNVQERYHFATRWANLATLNWLDALVAVSDDVKRSVERHKKLKIPVQTIVNGVDTDKFRPKANGRKSAKALLGIQGDTLVVGTVAVFRFQKRLDVWLDVAARIRSRYPNARFILVGDGPLRRDLEEKARALGLADHVHFAGLQTDVLQYLAAVDVYLMSSIFEGLPVALLEAMSCECAVVSTKAGGVGEVVRDEKEGLLCPVDDPLRLADLVARLLDDEDRRTELGKNARRRVEASFSVTSLVSELELLYRNILSPRSTK